MAWVIRDKEKLEDIVNNLKEFNDGLYQLMPKREEAFLTESVACAVTRDNDGIDLDEIISAVASLQYTDAAKLAMIKKKVCQVFALVPEQQNSFLVPSMSTLEIQPNRFQFSSRYSSEARTLATLDNSTKVIVEWKGYHPSMISDAKQPGWFIDTEFRSLPNFLAIALHARKVSIH
jgi:hypothetical protein